MGNIMNSTKFKKELEKIMPGYNWTVHRSNIYAKTYNLMTATGIQSAGFNRLSTVRIVRWEKDGEIRYEAGSAGFGKNAPCLSKNTDGTLARALRGLQDYYEAMASTYSNHAGALSSARKKQMDGLKDAHHST